MIFTEIKEFKLRHIKYEVLHNRGSFLLNGEEAVEVRWWCRICHKWHYKVFTKRDVKRAASFNDSSDFVSFLVILMVMITFLCALAKGGALL